MRMNRLFAKICLGMLMGSVIGYAASSVRALPLPDGSTAGLVVPAKAHGKLPLVVWLHGGIGANNPAKGLEAARNFSTWADTSGFTLLCPSAWPASPWWSASARQRLEKLLVIAAKDSHVDGHRIVFAGTSDGGAGILWLTQELRPSLGKRLKGVAVWSCDPSVLQNYGVSLDPRAFAGLPVRWSQGGNDRLFPLEDVRQWWNRFIVAHAKLESHPVLWAGHDLVDWQADLGQLGAWVRKLR